MSDDSRLDAFDDSVVPVSGDIPAGHENDLADGDEIPVDADGLDQTPGSVF